MPSCPAEAVVVTLTVPRAGSMCRGPHPTSPHGSGSTPHAQSSAKRPRARSVTLAPGSRPRSVTVYTTLPGRSPSSSRRPLMLIPPWLTRGQPLTAAGEGVGLGESGPRGDGRSAVGATDGVGVGRRVATPSDGSAEAGGAAAEVVGAARVGVGTGASAELGAADKGRNGGEAGVPAHAANRTPRRRDAARRLTIIMTPPLVVRVGPPIGRSRWALVAVRPPVSRAPQVPRLVTPVRLLLLGSNTCNSGLSDAPDARSASSVSACGGWAAAPVAGAAPTSAPRCPCSGRQPTRASRSSTRPRSTVRAPRTGCWASSWRRPRTARCSRPRRCPRRTGSGRLARGAASATSSPRTTSGSRSTACSASWGRT